MEKKFDTSNYEVNRPLSTGKNKKVKLNKPMYLGLSILEISKTLMYEFRHDYIKPKYGDSVKLCYMDTDGFIMHIKT